MPSSLPTRSTTAWDHGTRGAGWETPAKNGFGYSRLAHSKYGTGQISVVQEASHA
jgi:hypothetical protein